MKLIVCENYEEMSRRAAELIREQIEKKPDDLQQNPSLVTLIYRNRNKSV